MKNTTHLSLSNIELSNLCSDYGTILVIMCGIDGSIHNLEKKMLLSLITRSGFEGDNSVLGQVNHHSEKRKIEVKNLTHNQDYIRLFPIENIIFYELEKGIVEIIEKLDDTNWRKIDMKYLLSRVQKCLNDIKEVINTKVDILGEDAINLFYNSLYNYCYNIANCSGGGFSRNKITPEEDRMLKLIKSELEIDGVMNSKHTQNCRGSSIYINI